MTKAAQFKKWDEFERSGQLERVTEDDLAAALTDPDLGFDVEDHDFKELVRLAKRELINRFREDASTLPGTFLIKLVLDGQKAIAAGAIDPTEDLGEIDVLTALDALPTEHARALLQGEITRMQAMLDAYTDRLLELEAA